MARQPQHNGGLGNPQIPTSHGAALQVEQSRVCLFPTSFAKLGNTSSKRCTTSFLNGQSYSFGEFDVGSLDVGRNKNLYTSILFGAFRSEGVCGDGYFAREILADSAEFPHYLEIQEFEKRRNHVTLARAGDLVKFPKEVRIMIYKGSCLPSNPNESLTRNRTASFSMLLALQSTCSFLHDEISQFLYKRHAFYFDTPARLANFTRCLSYSPVPSPLKLGTIILEIRQFQPLIGINNLQQRVTFRQNTEDKDVIERDSTLCKPYRNFMDLRPTNPHFTAMRAQEMEVTRNWIESRHGLDWGLAIIGLLKYRVNKLIITAQMGTFTAFSSDGPLMLALDVVGECGRVKNVSLDWWGAPAPAPDAWNFQALKTRYGWN